MTAPIGVVLVGCGAVSERYYAPALAALVGAGRVRVDAVVDPAPGRRAVLGALLAPARQGADVAAVLADTRPALVIVASPAALHAEHALVALEHGAAVFCEKPLAPTSAEAGRMVAAAAAAGRPLAVGMVRRFLPAARIVRALVAEGVLGTPTSFEIFEGGPFAWPVQSGAYFAPANGGVLRDVGAHVLDLLAWWLGPLADVVADDDAMGGVDANAFLSLRAGGAAGRVRLSRDWARPNHVTIRGTRGEARWDLATPDRVVATVGGAPLVMTPGDAGPRSFEEAFAAQLDAMLDLLAGRPGATVTAAEVVPTIAALEQAGAGAALAMPSWLGPEERAVAQRVRHVAPPAAARAARPTVAIVGAGGFIGSRVVEMLHLEGDVAARPIVRRGAALVSAARFGGDAARPALDGRIADARDAVALRAALAGAAQVVHCVAGDPATIEESAEAVHHAAAAAGCRRLVYLSSASVHGQSPPPGTDERSPLSDHQPLAYNVAKVRAERRLAELGARSGVEVVVLRPGIVFGPRSFWIAALADAVLDGTAHFAGRADGVCNAIYVDNLVHAIRRALVVPEAAGGTYLVGDAEAPTWRDLYRPFVAALGGRVDDLPIVPYVPPPAGMMASFDRVRTSAPVQTLLQALPERLRLGLVAFHAALRGREAGALADGSAPRGVPSTASLEMTLLHGCDYRLPWTKAERELGYRPLVDFDEAVRRTIGWLAFAGYPVRVEGAA